MRLSTLVLDQNVDTANMLAEQLRHAGIHITVVSSALQAPFSVNELARRLAAFDRRDRPMC